MPSRSTGCSLCEFAVWQLAGSQLLRIDKQFVFNEQHTNED